MRDVTVRDTGPFTAMFIDGVWHSKYNGTHSLVVIGYSPEMHAWMEENRAPGDDGFGPDMSPSPDGAIIVKEMFPAPASLCRDTPVEHFFPTSGAAFMVRQASASADGWFWGYQGWAEAYLDWPADNNSNTLPVSGPGAYCVNCHASAHDNGTFSSLSNITGTPDSVAMFLDESVKDIALQDPLTAQTPAFHDAIVSPVAPAGQLTTSFLSICSEVKDNRLLPHGHLPESDRIDIALSLGADDETAIDAGSVAVGDDPDYADGNGIDNLIYRVPTDDLDRTPASVRVQLHFHATPPFYLQDRFCTAQGDDRDRLYFMTGHLNLDGTTTEDWKLLIADTGEVAVP